MMETIKVPQNLRRLNEALPKACYPDVRPNSPGAWVVAEQAQKAKLVAAEAKHDAENVPPPDTNVRQKLVPLPEYMSKPSVAQLPIPAIPGTNIGTQQPLPMPPSYRHQHVPQKPAPVPPSEPAIAAVQYSYHRPSARAAAGYPARVKSHRIW